MTATKRRAGDNFSADHPFSPTSRTKPPMSTAQRKADKQLVAEHHSWREWGEQFGFRLYGTNGRYLATFKMASGDSFDVPMEARHAIEAAIAKARGLQPQGDSK